MPDQVVVDSSVAIKWLVPQINSPQALNIAEKSLTGSLKLLAPDLIYPEIGNILWKLSRFGNLSQTECCEALALFQSIKLEITKSELILTEAYQFAFTHQRTEYDSLYIVLSQYHHCPFVTDDMKLVNALSYTSVNLIALQNWC